jgi:hypothetical protein
MHWTAILGLVAFFGLQGAFVAASLYAYNRIRSQQDTQGQQREAWSAQLSLAVTNADSAKRMAETIEVEHFRRLRSLFEVQAGELSEAKARIVSLEKELKVCQMKLASEERISRREEARKRKAEETEEVPEDAEVPTAPGGDVDSLLRKLGTRLGPQQPAAPAAPTKPPGFGPVAR